MRAVAFWGGSSCAFGGRVGGFSSFLRFSRPAGCCSARPPGVLLGFLFRMAHAMRSIAGPAGVTRTPPAQGSRRSLHPVGPVRVPSGTGRPPALRGISLVVREHNRDEIPAGDQNKPSVRPENVGRSSFRGVGCSKVGQQIEKLHSCGVREPPPPRAARGAARHTRVGLFLAKFRWRRLARRYSQISGRSPGRGRLW